MPPPRCMGGNFWSLAAGVYLICALGNLLMLAAPLAPPVVTDAAGRQWATSQINGALAAVSR